MTINPRNLSEKIKFITDHNLGKLAKWLRLIGYDTVCQEGKTARPLWEKALHENRIVLTRKKHLRYFPQEITTIIVGGERVEDQLAFIRTTLGLNPSDDQVFKRCSICNSSLNEVDKETVHDQVPPYVLENNDRFYQCPDCLRIYWPGSHVENIRKALKRHSPMDRP
jgi:uncharacterized protein with PIN domain